MPPTDASACTDRCGGGICPPCPVGEECSADSDCVTFRCSFRVCAPPSIPSDRDTGGGGTTGGSSGGSSGGSGGTGGVTGGGLLADDTPTVVGLTPREGPSGGSSSIDVMGHDFAFNGAAVYRCQMMPIDPLTGQALASAVPLYEDCKVVNDEMLRCSVPETKPAAFVFDAQYALRSPTGSGLSQGWTSAQLLTADGRLPRYTVIYATGSASGVSVSKQPGSVVLGGPMGITPSIGLVDGTGRVVTGDSRTIVRVELVKKTDGDGPGSNEQPDYLRVGGLVRYGAGGEIDGAAALDVPASNGVASWPGLGVRIGAADPGPGHALRFTCSIVPPGSSEPEVVTQYSQPFTLWAPAPSGEGGGAACAAFDASGSCCESGAEAIDACGVCGGDDSSCAASFVLMLGTEHPSGEHSRCLIHDAEAVAAASAVSPLRLRLNQAVAEDVSAALGVSMQRVTVRSVVMGAPGAVSVTVEVAPAAPGSNEPGSHELDDVLADQSALMSSPLNNGTATSCRQRSFPPTASRIGICGNGVCEVGEEASSCAADCEDAAPPGTDPDHRPPTVGPVPSALPTPQASSAPMPTPTPGSDGGDGDGGSGEDNDAGGEVGGKVDTIDLRPRPMGPPASPDDGMAATAATVGWVSGGIAVV